MEREDVSSRRPSQVRIEHCFLGENDRLLNVIQLWLKSVGADGRPTRLTRVFIVRHVVVEHEGTVVYGVDARYSLARACMTHPGKVVRNVRDGLVSRYRFPHHVGSAIAWTVRVVPSCTGAVNLTAYSFGTHAAAAPQRGMQRPAYGHWQSMWKAWMC